MKKNIIALTMVCMALCATQVRGTAGSSRRKLIKILNVLEKEISNSEEKKIKNGHGIIKKLIQPPAPASPYYATMGECPTNRDDYKTDKDFTDAKVAAHRKAYSPEIKLLILIIEQLKKKIEKQTVKSTSREK